MRHNTGAAAPAPEFPHLQKYKRGEGRQRLRKLGWSQAASTRGGRWQGGQEDQGRQGLREKTYLLANLG